MSDWYIKRGDRVIGPVSVERLEHMANEGRVRPDDLVRKDDGPYRNADQYRGLIPEFDDYDEDDFDDSRADRRRRDREWQPGHPTDVRGMVIGPAICMYLLCVSWIGYMGYCLAQNILMPEGMWVDDQVDKVRQTIGNVGFGAIIFANIVVLLGAVCLHIRRYYGMAMIGAIVSLVPIATPVCCLGIPFGVWAMIVLCNPDVRDDFH